MHTGADTASNPALPIQVIQDIPKRSKTQKQSRPAKKDRLKARGVFISDTHFGSLVELAQHLSAFFDSIRKPKYLVLAGDIFDFWSFAKKLLFDRPVFSLSEFTVLQKISKYDLGGTQVVYIPGNHDSIFRSFAHYLTGKAPKIYGRNLRILQEAVYQTADGRHFLVLHGDEFDPVVTKRQKLSQAATKLFDWMIHAGARLDALRHASPTLRAASDYLGLPTAHSTLNGIKARFDRATRTPDYQRKQIERLFAYNAAVFSYRRERPDAPAPYYLDGMICGHTHGAGLWSIRSPVDPESSALMGPEKVYVYDIGHWTGPYEERQNPPSCTALIEHMDGKLELVRWSARSSEIVSVNPPEQQLDTHLFSHTQISSSVSLRQLVIKNISSLFRRSPA